jgi:MATE family multidrug resistance protein
MSLIWQHLRASLVLGLPLIGSQVATNVITLTDTIMMGWYGVPELAAVALGGGYLHVVLIIGMGFALAVIPMVASAVANDDTTQARRVTRMGLWIAVIFGVIALPLFWFSGLILRGAGQDPGLADTTQAYLQLAGLGLLPALLMLVLRSHLSALERTRIVLWASLAGMMLNAGLNWVFIFGNLGAPEMGVRGAAMASATTHLLMFIVLAIYAARAVGMREYDLFARLWRPDWEAFGQVFRLGWPISATLLAESGLFLATMIMMGWIGQLELAAHGIALQIISLTFMIHIGLSQVATVRAGRAWGRRDVASLRLVGVAVLILSGITVALTMVLFLSMPQTLMGFFVDPADPLRPQILLIGTGLLYVAAVFQLADAAQVMALGLLRGVQDTRVPMIYAILSYWAVGVPCAWLFGFPLGLGGQGIWLGLVVGLVLAGVLMMARFWWGAAATGVQVEAARGA